jgi:hypothetical protein
MMIQITSAHAQVPRGETPESLAQDAENPIGFLLLFAVIAVFSAFKRSKKEGAKVLAFYLALCLLSALFPSAGLIIVGALGVVIAWGIFKSFA